MVADLLRQGSQWLGQMLNKHCSSPVTYKRGETEAVVNATFGRTEYEVVDESGLQVAAIATDFLISADELAQPFDEPRLGDRIIADVQVYEVLNLPGQGCW